MGSECHLLFVTCHLLLDNGLTARIEGSANRFAVFIRAALNSRGQIFSRTKSSFPCSLVHSQPTSGIQ